MLRPVLETLEAHLVPATAGMLPSVIMQPIVQVAHNIVAGASDASQTPPINVPWGLSPPQILSAYAVPQLPSGDGTGQTIAIVDAYDDPHLLNSTNAGFSSSDLGQFDQQFGLPSPPSFEKLNQDGGTTDLPTTDPSGAGSPGDWTVEEALDVEWAHAIAPRAAIILMECNSGSSADLYQGVMTAASIPGVSVVSMSWGCSEYDGESSFDGDFTTPVGHQGVTFVAAAGDLGSPGLFPAYSPNVIAVGGTSLTVLSNNTYGSETAWSNSGGGTSRFEPEPAFQNTVEGTGMRTIPDVAFDADPDTGVSVYDSYDAVSTGDPWQRIGGTSLGAPAWAALIAIADQSRVAAGGTTLNGPSQTLPALYSLSSGDFHDINTGNNGTFTAEPGYDEITGLGTPVADILVSNLASYDIAPQLAVTQSPPTMITAGDPFGLTVEVENPDGTLDTRYIGTVTVRLASNPKGDALGGTLTATAANGFAVFSNLTLTRAAAGDTLWVTTDGPAAAATTPFTVTPAEPAQLVITASPSGTTTGLTVTIEDRFGNLVTSFNGTVSVENSVGNAAHGRTAARHTSAILTTASQGMASFTRLKLAPNSRIYDLQVKADGLSATTVVSLEAKPSVVKSRKLATRFVHQQVR